MSAKQKMALVTVAAVHGSAPREVGAWMAVGADETTGTIGGGQLEYMAIDAARAGRRGKLEIPLGPEIGQCCGGHVTLHLTDITCDAVEARVASTARARPSVLVFGAGHTGRALFGFLRQLPVRAQLIDSRPQELALVDAPDATRLTPVPEAEVAGAPDGSAYVIATHDHALDFLIAAEAMARPDAAYVGLIGSRTKRARFAHWVRDHGSGADIARLTCPIGAAALGDKRPEVIAAFAAIEIFSALNITTQVSA